MSSHKTKEFKKFAIKTRKRITPGITSGPVFAMQKRRKRHYNLKGKRHWRRVDMGKMLKKRTMKDNRPGWFKGTKRNVGKGNPNQHRMHKKKE